jgi:hypothetical protein
MSMKPLVRNRMEEAAVKRDLADYAKGRGHGLVHAS